MSDQAMVPFEGNKFLARRKIFGGFGQKFHIFTSNGEMRFFVHQKAFKLKEAIHVWRDEDKTSEALRIQARSIMDFSGTYDVSTPEGTKVGALKREGLKSMLRDEWTILDANDTPIGKIQEDSTLMALLRRVFAALVPQKFDVTIGDQLVAEFNQHFNPFVAKYDVDFSLDSSGALDRRLGIAAVVLLLAIEGRQN